MASGTKCTAHSVPSREGVLMHRRSLLTTTTTTFLRQALTKAFCCRWMLLFSLLVLLLSPAGVLAAGVQALFNLETPTGGPFPSDRVHGG